jgi:hypothetical protein
MKGHGVYLETEETDFSRPMCMTPMCNGSFSDEKN